VEGLQARLGRVGGCEEGEFVDCSICLICLIWRVWVVGGVSIGIGIGIGIGIASSWALRHGGPVLPPKYMFMYI
jgi:hypothetical protein